MPPALSYGYLTGAYYYDTGIFGATSPILGQNIGIAVQPALGKVSFTTASVDIRKYFMPVKPVHPGFPRPPYGALRQELGRHPILSALYRLLGPRPRL